MTIKKQKRKIKKRILNFFQIPQLLRTPVSVITQTRIKKDASFVEQLQEHMDGRKLYTYCLNGGVLIMAETSKSSKLQDEISKHIHLCSATAACVSGEARFRNGKLRFDNSSGTYSPTLEQLKILKKLFSFAPTTIKLEGRTV